MRTRISAFIFLTLSFGCLSSCRKNHYKVNISSIKAEIEIKRLEKDLFTVNPNELISSVPAI